MYVESLFDELSTEVKVLFDRRDPAAALWPRRQTFIDLLAVLNATELSGVWGEDETIGWVYQYFNSGDERRAMRDASQAPRNSRELAIRNQFFTPRYVVQFLTDNTLGRIWYEMRGGNTRLVETCEYMVRRPDETYAPREKKDPRDLAILDPACGSGHFLLYAFDLLLVIYEEAWSDPEAHRSNVTRRTIREDYPEQADLRIALPGLVLRHNLHGVDIDARCAQIAQLALWMRAQRAFRDFEVSRAKRPLIKRANVVIAEPMPGEKDLIEDFTRRLDDPSVREVFSRLVTQLEYAGELGLLLRVEQCLPARSKEQLGLFSPSEDRIRETLRLFLEEAGGSQLVRRRLFAEDAGQGVGLLELAGKRYEVVLMNPPFGSGATGAKREFEHAYPRTKNDVLAAFVERGIELLWPGSRLGAITSRTGFFLPTFESWRVDILLTKAPPIVFADLGHGVLDGAMVETAAYCLEVLR